MESTHTQLQGWIKLDINEQPKTESIHQCFTSDTIKALRPILRSLQIIDHECASNPGLEIIIEATLKIVAYIINGVGAHLQNMETQDEQTTLFKGLMELDLVTCRFVQSAMMKSIVNGCPTDQVEEPLKKLEGEIKMLTSILSLYERIK